MNDHTQQHDDIDPIAIWREMLANGQITFGEIMRQMNLSRNCKNPLTAQEVLRDVAWWIRA